MVTLIPAADETTLAIVVVALVNDSRLRAEWRGCRPKETSHVGLYQCLLVRGASG